MIKKISRTLSVINQKSFAIEPEDLTNSLHRKEDLKYYYSTDNHRDIIGKATNEGFKYFQSRNLECGLISNYRKL